LKKEKMEAESISEEFVDVTDVFKQTKCKVIQKALDKHQKVKAVKLPKFRGLLKQELIPGFRLGTEMADRARFWGRVGGIFHTDEMPAYGVTAEEVEALRKAVNASEEDAVVFVADVPENAADALRAVVERAQEAIDGVPAETRAANADGTTRYMRPRPGAARMYPETDIPPSLITSAFLDKVRSNLPEPAEKKLERLMKEYSLNEKLAKQIADSEYSVLFEVIVKESGVSATTIAAFLTETVKALKRDGVHVENVSDVQVIDMFSLVGLEQLAKEAIPEVFGWLSRHGNGSAGKAKQLRTKGRRIGIKVPQDSKVYDAMAALGLEILSKQELEELVDRVIAENKQSVVKLGKNAFGMLMGMVMKEVRGKANPELVSKLLKERLK
jgi:glutamyl-tRNA(Gln) amidotransferase subunit E